MQNNNNEELQQIVTSSENQNHHHHHQQTESSSSSSSSMVKITVQLGKSKEESYDIPSSATINDLKKIVLPRVSVHRKSFKFIPAGETDPKKFVNLSEKKPLADQGVQDGSRLVYKDLGPQIGYRTVFVVEYAGPIAIMLLYALRPSFIYGSDKPLSREQQIFGAAFILHFVKRELETFFIHKFSRPTMPLMNLFKNSMYYWAFSALVGYALLSPQYTPQTNSTVEMVALVGWGISELLNFAVHYQLSTMRSSDGDQTRKAPRGGLFSLASCPNYTFEVLGWAFFSLGTNILSSWAFTAVGFLQMADWAMKKHRDYVKNEPDLKKRAAIVPFVY